MKTTIDIANPLFKEAKRFASTHSSNLRTVVESALRQFLKVQQQKPSHFKLKKASFKGEGLREGLHEGDWKEIRSKIYEGRGG